MNSCMCCDARTRTSSDDVNRNSVLLVVVDEQIKKIESQYRKYVSGELNCTPKQGAIIINNYNSRRKIEKLL